MSRISEDSRPSQPSHRLNPKGKKQKEIALKLENLELKIEEQLCQEAKCRNGLRTCDHTNTLMMKDTNPHRLDSDIQNLNTVK